MSRARQRGELLQRGRKVGDVTQRCRAWRFALLGEGCVDGSVGGSGRAALRGRLATSSAPWIAARHSARLAARTGQVVGSML